MKKGRLLKRTGRKTELLLFPPVNSVKGGSDGEKFSLLVKIKFGFLFSGENFSEMSFLLQEISLLTLVLRSKR